ncbi:MAG: phospholipid carrier-dependent glycosyltransferase [candidate division FCPU426 bacterium]
MRKLKIPAPARPQPEAAGRAPWAWLAALAVAWTLSQALWLTADQRPFAWDESIHYMGALGYYRILHDHGPGLLPRLLYQSDFYPPLAESAAGAAFLLFGPGPDRAAFFNTVYVLGILLLLFLLGRRQGDGLQGAGAAYLFAAGSMVCLQAKFFMLDLPLTFWVLLGYYFFLRSEAFARLRWSLGFGAVFGLALLTKWSAVFFLLLPPLGAGLTAVSRGEIRASVWLRNAFLALGLAALLAGPWYAAHLLKLVRNTSGYFHARGVLENDPSLLSPAAWWYYLLSVLRQLGWPLGLAVLAGLAWALIRRGRGQGLWWAWWLGAPYLVLTLIRNKDNRYTLPLLPLICLAGVSALADLSPRARRRTVQVLMLLALLQLAYVHVGQNAGWVHQALSFRLAGSPLVESLAPDPRVWPLETILAEVESLSQGMARPPILRVIPDHAAFSKVAFVVAQAGRRSRVQLSGATDWPAFTDFAVTKTGSLGLDFAVEKPQAITRELLDPGSPAGRRFELVGRYPLPDQSEALLYRRREVAAAAAPAPEMLKQVESGLAALLAAYVKNAAAMTIQVTPASEQETQLGHLQSVRVRAQQALLGDFKHKPFGVHCEQLDVEVAPVVFDWEAWQEGRLVLYDVGSLTVHSLNLQAEAVNDDLAEAEGDLQRLSLEFSAGRVTALWQGKPEASVRLRLSVVPDPHLPDSQNLRFDLQSAAGLGLTLPGWLLQPWVEDFNPLFKLAGFPGRIRLGTLQAENSVLSLGSQEQP